MRKGTLLLTPVLVALFVLAGLAPAVAAPTIQTEETVMEVAADQEQLATFVQAVESTGLIDTLDGEGPFTIFAPTNDAFAALEDQDLSDLMVDSLPLEQVLQYHVVPLEIIAGADVDTSTVANSLSGQPLDITFEGEMMTVNGAQVVLPPGLEAANGIVYIIDQVLMPPEEGTEMAEPEPTEEAMAEPAEEETAVTDEIMAAGDAPAMCVESYVVQADDWLSKIAAKFYGDPLAYPVIADATNAVSAESEDFDAIADVDVIEIGQILCIPSQDEAITLASDEPEMQAERAIVSQLGEDGRFVTLVEALQVAGLADRFQAEGPYTFFAPTDDAFAKLPPDELTNLLNDPTAIADVLMYHVVPEELNADEVAVLDATESLLGRTLDISTEGDIVRINEAQVVEGDILASNGVIHAIDTVLQPSDQAALMDEETMAEDQQMDIVEVLVEDGRFETLFEALQETGLIDTLREEGPYTLFAPTDEAFGQMGDELPELLQDREQLADYLRYHVVAGETFSNELPDSVQSISEKPLVFIISEEATLVNEAEVVDADIEAANGVIHAINRVLEPPQ